MVKVLHIGKYFPPHHGGMETFLRDLMVEQKKQGHETAAIVHTSQQSFRSEEQQLTIHGQTIKVLRVARWFTASFAPISPIFPIHLAKTVKQQQPDVLHLHMPNLSAFWCLLLPACRKIPWVIQWQSDVVPSKHRLSLRLLARLYRIPERLLLQKAAVIIASSHNYLESSPTLANWQAKSHVIPLAISPPPSAATTIASQVESPRPETPPDMAKLRVLTVGRLTYYKGHRVMVEAMAQAPHCHLTIVGDGEEKRSIVQLIERLQLGKRVTLIDKCSDADLEAQFAGADLFCLASVERTESFGLVLLEAMARGVPCVVSQVDGSGMTWITDEGRSGFMVPPATRLRWPHY
jgi:glycosyltransferase involved in cell wall biosynthesis